ncbi:late competence development ComFB family protein [Pseudodesulfovibrio sp. zrk46]|uniref:late competence development ComFB family protein n=1 Tax=Pseudodesulfovibrio sp. zrk46 TaxID=2725288 RepID=UPI001449C5F8|nr:late competence development ComFB family protein [Pseudodesulfovibrio sp. zrk46]QJB55146.1 late competence development ComFB family protein [Pseudodesulfovibrio sp. zrk46]
MPSSIKFEIRGVDVSKIRNRNEKRVVRLIPEILDEYYEDYVFESLDIEDIYALTLNLLPARYIQYGSLVISDHLSDYEIKSRIRDAVERVLEHPTRANR